MAQTLKFPVANPYVQPIPQPAADLNNLAACVMALKNNVENLTGFRGNRPDRAVLFTDLINYGLLDASAVGSQNGSAGVPFDGTLYVPKAGGTMTGPLVINSDLTVSGVTTVVTPPTADNSTRAATTAWVRNQNYAPLASPLFTGDPRAPTPATTDNDTSVATTAYVKNQGYATTAQLGNYVLKAGDTMTGQLTVNAAVAVQGAGGIFLFNDRTTAATWGWYATGGTARLWNATSGDRLTVDASGNFIAVGTVAAGGNGVQYSAFTGGGSDGAGTHQYRFGWTGANLVFSVDGTTGIQLANASQLGNYVLKTGDTMTGPLQVNSTITATGVIKGNQLRFLQTDEWAWYNSASGVATLWMSGDKFAVNTSGNLGLLGNSINFANSGFGATGPRMVADTTNIAWQTGSGNGSYIWYNSAGGQLCSLNNAGSMQLLGPYLYLGGGTGTINAAGGPFIYADATYLGFHLGTGNGGWLFQTTSGANVANISNNGIYNSNGIAAISGSGGAGGYVIVYDGSGNQAILCGGSSGGLTNYYRNTSHNFGNIGGTVAYALMYSGGLLIYPSGDTGADTTRAGLSATKWRFKQASGDEASAGVLDYGVINTSALSIVGKGSSIPNRNVQIYDNLFVGTIQSGQILSAGTGAAYFFQNRSGSDQWALYSTDPGGGFGTTAIIYHSTAGNRFGFNDTIFAPLANNACKCGVNGFAWNEVWSYAYQTASDRRQKTDFRDLPNCLDLVRTIVPQRFRWNHGIDRKREHWGFIAQDVEAAMEEAGHEFGGHSVTNGRHALNTNEMTAVLWQAVRELAAEVAALRGAP